MHRKMQRRWTMHPDSFIIKLFLQLVLVLFISQCVSSNSNIDSNEANINLPGIVNHILLDCQTPNCQTAKVSVSTSNTQPQPKKSPVYIKSSEITRDSFPASSNPDMKWLKVHPGGLNNYQNNYQHSHQSYPSSIPTFTPIQHQISYLNNLTSSPLHPQFSTVTKQTFDAGTGGSGGQANFNDNYFAGSNQAQIVESSYLDQSAHYYQPEATEYASQQWIDPQTEQSQYYQTTGNEIFNKEDPFNEFSDIIDHVPIHEEYHLETSGVKKAIIFVAIWYLLIAVLVQGSFSKSGYSQCDGGHGSLGHDFPLSEITVQPERVPFLPHDISLQKSVYDMFEVDGSDDGSMEVPDLSHVSNMCSRSAFYYGMNQHHMMAVQMTMDILMGMQGPHEMMKMAKAMKHSPDMNPKVWYEAIMRASHEREDMSGMIMPGPMDAMPDNFIPGHAFNEARSSLRSRGGLSHRNTARSHKKKKEQKCTRVDGNVGKDNGIENLLWYFREDVMVNSHHWYWHLAYPLMSKIRRDRQGELFYFAHRSMLMRYNMERLSNGLDIAEPFPVYRGAVIPEGYNPHLDEINSGMPWTERPRGLEISDIRHEENRQTPTTIIITQWLETGQRLIKSIKTGYFISRKGTRVSSHGFNGIDILGNTLEATDRSINPQYYDPSGYHNQGHQLIGNIVDPYYERRLPPGPMAEPATAMRDPAFYTWHTHVNNIFEKYKRTLKPYRPVGGEFPLLWDGVVVNAVKVLSKGRVNDLVTFFGKRKYELALGLALSQNETDHDHDSLKVCSKHLNHEDFKYELHIDRKPCAKSLSNAATVRIFIAPTHDVHGRRLTMKEQRRFFVHLDVFTTKLSIGRNVITRRSVDSSLTIPWTKTLEVLKNELGTQSSPYCGCGWPHHLLLPRGNPHGMPFDIFVMVTNGDDDLVMDDSSPFGGCQPAPIYCGINNKKYPDAKPMGYPFDRELYKISPGCKHAGNGIWGKLCNLLSFGGKPPLYLEDYMAGITNMGSTQVVITHKH